LKVVHCLTRETDRSRLGRSVREGRIRLPLLRELIPEPRGCDVYVCGPGISKWDLAAATEAGVEPQPRFLESVLADLAELGVPSPHIRREFYG
jgi:ferredoxin-NADP reductase